MDRQPVGFRVALTMHIHEGMAADFERTWHEVSAAVSRHPANLGHWLMRCDGEDGVYYIFSDWVSEPLFREFESSAEHVEHRQRLHPYRASGSIKMMRVLGHVPGDGVSAA